MTKTDSQTVTIYSTPSCAFCKTLKQYLDHMGVSYANKDVEQDPAAMQELKDKLGGTFSGVPVTDIAGSIIRGFDRPKIDATLKQQGLIPA